MVSTFEEGKQYYYKLVLKHKTAYGWDSSSSLDIKNIDWIVTFSEADLSTGTLGFFGGISPVKGYNVTVNPVEGVTTTPTGVTRGILEGSCIDIEIKANEGYKITAVKVNGEEQTLPLFEDTLSIENIKEDINVVIETEKEKSELKQINLIGDTDNQEFIKGTDKTLTFILNNRGYGKVFVDGVELNEANGDYNWALIESLPYITISEDYLKTLKVGKHTIKFIVDNVGEAETTFTIVEQEDKENNDKDNTKEDTTKDNSNNPQTGDNIMLYVAILGIAIIGIVVTTGLRKD